jgi:coiled-coil and C2 domain-containing protein 2A
VIGNGIPEGKTVYVMRVKLSNPKEDIVFWNASTGEGFAVDDETCPLRIGTIVNQDNIWVNIQSTDDPSHMEFKLSDPNCFKCFFDAKYPKGQMETCQIPVLEYTIPDELYLEQLERQILNTLKEEFREWRGNRAMTLQSVLEKELQATLESMEYEVSGLQGDVPFSTYEHIRSLEKYTRNYKMYGFPINASFTDIKSILRKVKATDVHQSEIPASKFAFGVKCVGYPCGVISVWIYIATLEPIR